ncbi:MAG: AAA family ATPase [Patescibacteria group bacterium]|nr:AAA family ATPase [bacterium]MDZ4205839.1 AAA family ATPase [Patescibacteria group bacterium]
MSEKLNPEQWEEAEVNLDKAEPLVRKRTLAVREKNHEDNPEIVADLDAEAEILATEVTEILGDEGSAEQALKDFRLDNLKKALRQNRANEIKHETLIRREAELLESMKEAEDKGLPVRGKRSALDKVREDLDTLAKNENELEVSSPEAFYGLRILELKHLKEQSKGKIVETPYVKHQAEDIYRHIKTGEPIMIYGHFGTGKTELAIHVSQKYLGKEPLIISGRKDIGPEEIYGHQKLSVDRETKATISEFYIGPIYRAMKEGLSLIIDEVNAIPHEIIISLNHILTRRAGEEVDIQMDSGEKVTIQKGFCIIMTGNLNQGQEQYIAREDMDTATLSRIHQVEYDYLPQKTEGSLEESGEGNELFHLILARVMDKQANIDLPEGSVRKLWNLAKAARITQDVFAGREVKNAYYFQQGSSSVKYFLQKSVLTMRALNKIMTQWQGEQYKQELDYYIYKEFISQSTIASDRAYLYQLFKDRFGFFQGHGWEQTPDYGAGGVVTSFDVDVPENKNKSMEFFGPRQTVEFAYGEAPKRTVWPEANVSKTAVEEIATENFIERAQKIIEILEEEERQNTLLDREVAEASATQ